MSPQHAMSFTPDVYEDDFGETHYNLANGELKSSAPREAAQQHNLRHQDDGWVEDEDGTTSYVNATDEADVSVLMEQFGGVEAYNEAIQWASNNLSQEAIEEYDAVIEAGDLTEITDYITQLKEMYDSRVIDNDEPDDYIEAVRELVGGRDNYEEMVGFITDNFDADFIDGYNAVIDSGDLEEISKVINALQSYANQL